MGDEKRRLRDSPVGNVLVITVTTLLILAGVWVVNTMRDDNEPSAAESPSGAVSEVELTGDTSGAAPKVGSPAPEFTIFDVKGDPITLSELKGKPVWLIFGATWCSNCRAETPDVQAVQEKYGEKTEIVAIYVGESISTVADYADRLGLTYTQVADKYTDVGSSYRVMGLPTHVFVDAEGNIAAIEVGTLTEQAASKHLDGLLK